MKDEECIIDVKVIPKAKKSEIVGWENDQLKIRVTAAPEKGKANEEVVKLLSKKLGIPKRQITIVQGKTSRQKKIKIPSNLNTVQLG